jgi:hypothetical protein
MWRSNFDTITKRILNTFYVIKENRKLKAYFDTGEDQRHNSINCMKNTKKIPGNADVVMGITIFVFILMLSLTAFSQGTAINKTGAPAHPSAMLDVSGTGGGVLVNRMSTTERNNIAIACACTPAEGLLIFNTDTKCFEAFVNSTWNSIWCPCTPPATPTAAVHTPLSTQIAWHWNTSNTYPGAGVNVITSPTFSQTGLSCNTAYTLYVWAYNACGYSSYVTLTQTTLTCTTCTLDLQVNASANDVTRWDPGFDIMDNLLCGHDGAQTISSAMRFTNVTIPQGATITAAYLTLYTEPVNNPGSGITVNTNIYAENSDNAAQITSNADYDSRALTSPEAWNGIPAWAVNSSYNSQSIISVIQAVVSRPGWTSGNAIHILWKDNASSSGAWRRCYSYNFSTIKAPKLHIEYNCP